MQAIDLKPPTLAIDDDGVIRVAGTERITRGEPMPGLVAIRGGAPIRHAIGDLVLLVECAEAGEVESRVVYLPFP